MKDNSVEAVPGYEIAGVQGLIENSAKYMPNVVLINAGHNDCFNNDDEGNIGNRMSNLLDTIFNKIPGTTVILSTLPPTLDAPLVACHNSANAAFRSLVTTRSAQGQKILLADMDPASTSYWNTVIGGDYFDTYSDTAPINTCAKAYGNSEATKRQTQSGSGWDDGIYIHHGDPRGERRFFGDYPGQQQHFYFASITVKNSPWDDLIQYQETTSGGNRKYFLYRATGPGIWEDVHEEFWIPDTCIARGVRWADMNGDGLDDFVCIAPNGDAVSSFNRGGLSFENLGIAKHNEGPVQKYIRLGDIDGDGRCDYCALNDDGSMRCWRNGGLKDISDNWQAMGTVFNAKNFGDIDGVRLVDINGDGRSDYLWVDDDGQTWTYTNSRGCVKGNLGQGLTPIWRAGENREYGAGPTMIGIGYPNVRNEIQFGKVYGNTQSFGFHSSRDYIYVEETARIGAAKFANGSFYNSSTPSNVTVVGAGVNSTGLNKRADIFTYEYSIKVWENNGIGGGKLKGDGDRYCNMMGHLNNRQDYVWIYSNGKMWIWEALNEFPAQPKYWGDDYLMWDITASRSLDRRDLHLSDWDGDGACDIIYADPNNGNVEVWINQIRKGGGGGKPTFIQQSNPAPGVSCDQPRGYGQFDVAVRFADVTGNGRPDYLCMERDGRTKGYLHNTDGSFTYQSQIKQSDGYDRANLRFADVDGDGLADLLWTDKFRGDAMVWKNQGRIPAAGTASSFTWTNLGFLYNAPSQGTCLEFPDLDGNGRADMVAIEPLENTATTWFNNCPDGGSADDPDTLTSAGLPSLPAGGGTDPGNTNNEFILGYHAFGDSYAAGIGAGSGEGPTYCRRGMRSYPKQTYAWLQDHGNENMFFRTAACSGDTLDGVKRQIDDFYQPEKYDVLSLSVGGNDIGFGELVDDCILTYGPITPAPAYAKLCEDAKTKARNKMQDTSTAGIGYGFKEIYKQLINKARTDAQLYVTAYVPFFNAQPSSTWCNDVTFYYWAPKHYDSDQHDSRYVYLDVARRQELNDLVLQLNTLIEKSVAQANSELGGSNRIYFVQPKTFVEERFCEQDVSEPDEDRPITNLFLSGWKDNWDQTATAADTAADIAEIQAQGGQIVLPNADTCTNDLGTDPDPYAYFLCRVAQEVQTNPSGNAATRLQGANAALARGDFGSADIPFYLPTSTAKTFHPRSMGHHNYMAALVDAMYDNGQWLSSLGAPDVSDYWPTDIPSEG
ncbi:hypothetical protein N0V82_008243 [Gnomoniopsis sp. IMI 355080]|nr:hypothetical protein N0V82_008243 [Gnomoniopsis sp. IMI 355080]